MDTYYVYYDALSSSGANTSFVQGAVTIFGIVLTAILTYYFTRQNHKYEKMFERKLMYLEEIYEKIIALEVDLKKYLHLKGAEMNDESIDEKRKELKVVREKFFELQRLHWKREIILDESSVNAIQSVVDVSNVILAKLSTSIVTQQLRAHEQSFDYWDEAFQMMENKFAATKEQLKRDFKNGLK